MRTLAAATLSRGLAQDRARGVALSTDLLQEILAAPFAAVPAVVTPSPDRSTFDDIGDYYGWSASPPQRPDGAPIAPASWRREVTLTSVNPANPQAAQAGSNLVRVTVRVWKGTRLVATADALRSAAWDTAIEGGGP
jgi:hypothetical protein